MHHNRISPLCISVVKGCSTVRNLPLSKTARFIHRLHKHNLRPCNPNNTHLHKIHIHRCILHNILLHTCRTSWKDDSLNIRMMCNQNIFPVHSDKSNNNDHDIHNYCAWFFHTLRTFWNPRNKWADAILYKNHVDFLVEYIRIRNSDEDNCSPLQIRLQVKIHRIIEFDFLSSSFCFLDFLPQYNPFIWVLTFEKKKVFFLTKVHACSTRWTFSPEALTDQLV